jgi:cytidylate kinase
MSVITISRGSFLGGKLLAQSLAKKLGYRSIDRKLIVKRATIAGLNQRQLHDALLKPPTLIDWIVSHHKYVYLALLQAALAEEVQEGKAVYHGFAGHLLLSDASPVFRVRIIAAEKLRLKMAQEHMHLSRKEAADKIREIDQQRRKWTQALYGVNWEDPSLYDMVLNLGRLFDIEEGADLIASIVRENKCLQWTARHQNSMKNFALASRIRASLATEFPAAKIYKVRAKKGLVSVSISLSTQDEILDVKRLVKKIPGVEKVEVNK